jgi:hypothetical protein
LLLFYNHQLSLWGVNEIAYIDDYNIALNQLGFRKGTTLEQHQLMVDGVAPAVGASGTTAH